VLVVQCKSTEENAKEATRKGIARFRERIDDPLFSIPNILTSMDKVLEEVNREGD